MRAIPAALRRLVIEVAGGRCEYCRLPDNYSPGSFAVDHVQPLSREGDDNQGNLAYACPGCNGSKHDKIEAIDPLTSALVPLFNPRNQLWREHFRWSDDWLLVIGLTETGRATTESLQLNRMGVVNLRRVLLPDGLHPPRDA